MMMAWQCTPHSLFCEKRECAVHGGREKTGARRSTDCLLRMSLPAAWCGWGFWRLTHGLSFSFRWRYPGAERESLRKMAASEAPPLIWHALKKKSGKRSSGGTTDERQRKEQLVHSATTHSR